MIRLAHDGSVNGDWVARYALQLATHTAARRVEVLHVAEGASAPRPLETVRADADALGVECVVRPLAGHGDVVQTLSAAVAGEPDSLLICGTRIRSQGQGLLNGTVSDRLLRSGPCRVLALRVVRPSLLGAPHRVLLPVAGHPAGLAAARPFVRLFAPQLTQAHVLRVMTVRRRALLRMRAVERDRLRAEGRRYVDRIEAELTDAVGVPRDHVETFVRIAADWVAEVLVHAGHHRAQLILAGASQRGLADRLLHGSGLERLLRDAPCDVAVYRGRG